MQYVHNRSKGRDRRLAFSNASKRVLKPIIITVVVILALPLLLIVFDFCRNLSHNTAVELWQKSGADNFFPAKVIAQNSYEDTATFLIDGQYKFTLDCTDKWFSMSTPTVSCQAPDVDIAYPTLHGDLRSFMFALHREEIAEIVEKYPLFQYNASRQVFNYAGSSKEEIKDFVDEVLSIPDLGRVAEFCMQAGDYYLCKQSDVAINFSDKIEVRYESGYVDTIHRTDIFTVYKWV